MLLCNLFFITFYLLLLIFLFKNYFESFVYLTCVTENPLIIGLWLNTENMSQFMSNQCFLISLTFQFIVSLVLRSIVEARFFYCQPNIKLAVGVHFDQQMGAQHQVWSPKSIFLLFTYISSFRGAQGGNEGKKKKTNEKKKLLIPKCWLTAKHQSSTLKNLCVLVFQIFHQRRSIYFLF